MKAYIQYLDYDNTGKLSEPCGDRAVVELDGRNKLTTWIDDAYRYNGFRRKRYPAFKIMKGDLHHSKCIYYKELPQ